jgi:hypothetical protein
MVELRGWLEQIGTHLPVWGLGRRGVFEPTLRTSRGALQHAGDAGVAGVQVLAPAARAARVSTSLLTRLSTSLLVCRHGLAARPSGHLRRRARDPRVDGHWPAEGVPRAAYEGGAAPPFFLPSFPFVVRRHPIWKAHDSAEGWCGPPSYRWRGRARAHPPSRAGARPARRTLPQPRRPFCSLTMVFLGRLYTEHIEHGWNRSCLWNRVCLWPTETPTGMELFKDRYSSVYRGGSGVPSAEPG